jgi:hypothetical protein
MFSLGKYDISETAIFSAVNFPEIVNELEVISQAIFAVPERFKSEIVVSFVKFHMVKSEWANLSPMLVKLISARSLPISNMERLFESSKNNKVFLKDLENFIYSRLNPVVIL